MRQVLLILALGSILPLTLIYPHVGLLLWGWLTLMQPQQEVWTLPTWLQLNFIVALVTIACWLISREPKLPRLNALIVCIIGFVAVLALSQFYSLEPGYSWTFFDRHMRALAFIVLCLIMLHSRVRIHAMIWVFAISIGYYGVLGGAFTLATAGRYLVLGPEYSVIGDNNQLGLALVTTIPMINYLRLQSRVRLVRFGLIGTMALSLVAVFGTHSRGALISLVVMGLLFLVKTRARLLMALLIGTTTVAVVAFMPVRWEMRMESIANFEEDQSFQGRVDAWIIAYEVAKARPLVGAGPRVPYVQQAVDPYLSQPREARASHSIYFEVLGSMGFVGLGLFLAIILVTWRELRWLERHTSEHRQLQWAHDFAAMCQISFLSFLVGGAALSMEFWEGFWLLIALASCAGGVVRAYLAAPAAQSSFAALARSQAPYTGSPT